MQEEALHGHGHEPVMAAEVGDFFAGAGPSLIVDGTAGGGGHTAVLAGRFPDARILAVDRDPSSISSLPAMREGVTAAAGSYADIPGILNELGLGHADAALFDLGLSSIQLDDPARGFSHRLDGPLDMRFDVRSGLPTAAEVLAAMSEREVADMIFTLGEEGRSRPIARCISAARPVETTGDLARAVRRAVRGNPVKVLSRVFQALRIQVNDELGELRRLLEGLPSWMSHGGRAAFITFHSIEDRLVKRFFADSPDFSATDPPWMVPGAAETRANPRARSARLRTGVRA